MRALFKGRNIMKLAAEPRMYVCMYELQKQNSREIA